MTSRTNIAASFVRIETQVFSADVVPKMHLMPKEGSTFHQVQTAILLVASVALKTLCAGWDVRNDRVNQSEQKRVAGGSAPPVTDLSDAVRLCLTGTLNSIQPIEEPKSSGAGRVENGLA
jgi:hypothetical protein